MIQFFKKAASYITKLITFAKGVFLDGDKPSASRVTSMMLALFACGWVTYLVHINHALPSFDGLAVFISTPYGLNVASKAVGSLKSSGDQS